MWGSDFEFFIKPMGKNFTNFIAIARFIVQNP